MAGIGLVATVSAPETIDEVADVVRSASTLTIVGADGHRGWRVDDFQSESVSTSRLTGIRRVEPQDQIVEAQSGVRITALQEALSEVGQCLPYAAWEIGDDPTLGGAISLGLPHRLDAACGSWRDWVLGMTIVRGDGAIVKCGSSAVKNVAGYDVQKLLIGGRGKLGIIVSVILKTLPLRALPVPLSQAVETAGSPIWLQRVRPCDATDQFDRSTSTLWRSLPCDEVLPRYPGDWVLRRGCGKANIDVLPNYATMNRVISRLEPDNKLNPGAFGR